MQLIATDILADLCGLSLGLILLVLPVGLMLWLLGWWSHRFWIVLTTTVLAGLVGLNQANTWRAQPIVVAVLLAVAAGVLALALVRVIAFLSGGVAGLYLIQMLAPTFGQPAIVFLVSGLLSLLVFRWCFMALTSLLGSVCLLYAMLALLHFYQMLDALRWSEENRVLLNSVGGGAALAGFLFQMILHRRRMRRLREESGEEPGMIAGVIGKVTGRILGKAA
jgi:hypothetical protein